MINPELVQQFRTFATNTLHHSSIELVRQFGVTHEMLTDEEIIRGSQIFRDRRLFGLDQYIKDVLVRHMRRMHSPSQTAEFLKNNYRSTFEYFCWMTLWLLLIKFCQDGLNVSSDVLLLVRLVMTVHLSYYNVLWIYSIIKLVWFRAHRTTSAILHLVRKMPRIVWELTTVLFEVFIGWPLLFLIMAVLTNIYLVPLFYPHMRLSSAPIELAQRLQIDESSVEWIKWIF